MKLKRLSLIDNISKKKIRGRTGKGWATYNRRLKKVRPLYVALDNLYDWIFRYPFNKFGWTAFKYWFKNRLQKKHMYHKLDLGLKPGYYDIDTILLKALSSKRVLEQAKAFVDNYDQYANELGYPERKPIADVLRKAYDWFTVVKPRIEKNIEKRYEKLSKERPYKDFCDMMESFDEKRSNKFRRMTELESKIYLRDTEHMINIIKHRDVLWD